MFAFRESEGILELNRHVKDEICDNSPAENIKPETWVSHFESLATVEDKFVDRVSELQHLVEG